eukprot:3257413-Pleurochrysis_carterae.AAC.4
MGATLARVQHTTTATCVAEPASKEALALSLFGCLLDTWIFDVCCPTPSPFASSRLKQLVLVPPYPLARPSPPPCVHRSHSARAPWHRRYKQI